MFTWGGPPCGKQDENVNTLRIGMPTPKTSVLGGHVGGDDCATPRSDPQTVWRWGSTRRQTRQFSPLGCWVGGVGGEFLTPKTVNAVAYLLTAC